MAYKLYMDDKGQIFKNKNKLDLNSGATMNALRNDPNGQKLLAQKRPGYTDPGLLSQIQKAQRGQAQYMFTPTKFIAPKTNVLSYDQGMVSATNKYQPLIDRSKVDNAAVAQQQQGVLRQNQAASGELSGGTTVTGASSISGALVKALADIDSEGNAQKATFAQSLVDKSTEDARQQIQDAYNMWLGQNQLNAQSAGQNFSVSQSMLEGLLGQQTRADSIGETLYNRGQDEVTNLFNEKQLDTSTKLAYDQLASGEKLAYDQLASGEKLAYAQMANSRAIAAADRAARGSGSGGQNEFYSALSEGMIGDLSGSITSKGEDWQVGKYDKDVANQWSSRIDSFATSGQISPLQASTLKMIIRNKYPMRYDLNQDTSGGTGIFGTGFGGGAGATYSPRANFK